MRLKQVNGTRILSEQARRSIEKSFFHDLDGAVRGVQRCFPNHLVSKKDGRVCVSNRDGSMSVAVFQGVGQHPISWRIPPPVLPPCKLCHLQMDFSWILGLSRMWWVPRQWNPPALILHIQNASLTMRLFRIFFHPRKIIIYHATWRDVWLKLRCLFGFHEYLTVVEYKSVGASEKCCLHCMKQKYCYEPKTSDSFVGNDGA